MKDKELTAEQIKESTEYQALEEQLKRVTAEYANYRRRTQEQEELVKKRAAETLIRELLGIADNLELALAQASQQDTLYKGVELVFGQLISTLEEQGITKISSETYDPQHHEALMSEYSQTHKEGEIIEVLQQGYLLGGKVLRTAKVKVSKGKENK